MPFGKALKCNTIHCQRQSDARAAPLGQALDRADNYFISLINL